PTYRPSLETTLRWQAGQLAADQRALARGVAADRVALDAPRLAALAPADRAAVLEIAHDYLYYQLQSDSQNAPADAAHANAILLDRSRIARPSPFSALPTPHTPPDSGHHTMRIATSAVYEAGDLSLGLRIRQAYHDLLD